MDRNVQIQVVSGGNSFGVFWSHSHVTTLKENPPFYVGNHTHFNSVHSIDLLHRRPLSPSCRSSASKLCSSESTVIKCSNCLNSNSAALQDEGCDMQQRTDLDDLACKGSPTVTCVEAVAKVCAEAKGQEDWEVCNNCIREHHPAFQSQCTNTSEIGILYTYCLDSSM
jgi:hypothetical protein